MNIGKATKTIALGTSAGKLVMGILMLIHWILSWFVASIVPFLRTRFGSRYFSTVNFMFGLTAVGFFTGFGNALLSQGQSHMSYTIELAYYGVMALGVYHRFVIWRRNKKGILWHSYNPGISLIRIPGVSEEVVARWIEPLLLFVLAYIAAEMHDWPLRIWLTISGFALLVHEQIAYHLQQQTLLDRMDAMIESENWGAVMSGKSVKETAGYTIAKSNVAIIEKMPHLKESFSALPNDLRSIMDEVEA